jgi:hypothetical protein
MIPNYIDDGYEAKGYLAESENFNHGEFRFWYRPLSAPERDSFVRELDESKPGFDAVKAWDVSYKMLMRQIVRWDLLNKSGDALPINMNTLRRMNQNLIPRVRNIILGYLAPDRDPQDGESPEPETIVSLLEADAKN